MANIHILRVQLVFTLSTPRQDIITATTRKSVVSDSHNLVVRVDDTVCEIGTKLTKHRLVYWGLEGKKKCKHRTFASHGTQTSKSHKILVPTDVIIAFLGGRRYM